MYQRIISFALLVSKGLKLATLIYGPPAIWMNAFIQAKPAHCTAHICLPVTGYGPAFRIFARWPPLPATRSTGTGG